MRRASPNCVASPPRAVAAVTELPVPIGERRISDELTVAAPDGVADLYDPVTRRTVSPETVTLRLTRFVWPSQTSEVASVIVAGSRRLKSGRKGQPIDSSGWDQAVNRPWYSGAPVERPEWLTQLLADHLPPEWDAGLFAVNRPAREVEPARGRQFDAAIAAVLRRAAERSDGPGFGAALAAVYREFANAAVQPLPPLSAGPRTERERGRMDVARELLADAEAAERGEDL